MIDPKNIQEIIHGIIDALPPGLKNLPADAQQHMKSSLTNMFDRLDLVTREEFNAQQKVLLRTREKLEALEKKITALENKPE